MKRSMHWLNGIALIAALFSVPAWANETAPSAAALPASVQRPTVTEPLGNGQAQNVPMTIASASAHDLQRGPSPLNYGNSTPQIVPASSAGGNDGDISANSAPPTEPAGEIWMFLGAISIALVIAWRRCQWASLRGGSAISTGQRSPHPPQHRMASPIGLSAGHGHLPFGG
jgi:hypothetical protein